MLAACRIHGSTVFPANTSRHRLVLTPAALSCDLHAMMVCAPMTARVRWPIRAILALRAARGCRFVSRGPQLFLVGVTSLVGVADRIFSLPRPLMKLRPPKPAADRAGRNDIRAALRARIAFRLARLVAGSGGRMLIFGRCGFSSVCSAAPPCKPRLDGSVSPSAHCSASLHHCH